MFKQNKIRPILTFFFTAFLFSSLFLPVYADNAKDLEYLNIDLGKTDGVILRSKESDIGTGYMASGNGDTTYDRVTDLLTCTKYQVYSFFYKRNRKQIRYF